MAAKQRMALLWVLGGLFIFFGARIAGSADKNVLGATDALYYTALFVSLILILLGGFFWISISGAMKEEFEPTEHLEHSED